MNPAPSPDEADSPAGVLGALLWLSLWLACVCLVVAVVAGLGPHPLRRLTIGVVLVAGCAAAVWRRQAVTACLRASPWLVVPVAVAVLGAATLDGLTSGGTYVALTVTPVAVAVTVARARTVWICVALLDVGCAAAIVTEKSLEVLWRNGDAMSALLRYPFVALLTFAVVRGFARLATNVDPIVDSLRSGAPTLTPALGLAIQRGRPEPRQLTPAPPVPASRTAWERLTPVERRVVEGLARGSAPKELAYRWGISLTTVRTHIRNAKRKTGARTLSMLAAMASEPSWPKGGARAD